MANLLDYLDWRGDLTFQQAAFNEVDNLILSELSYVDFFDIVPGPGEGEGVPLHRAAEAFFARFSGEEKIDLGILMPDELPELVRRMAGTARFRDLRLSCYEARLDTEQAQQFAAVTIELDKRQLFIAFRGTDDTLAGWREDFYMACMPEIPAQKMAVDYLKRVAKQYPRFQLQVGGHSKGGNLAVYAAVFCPKAVQRRIRRVWSNDGPGFHNDILSLEEYERIAPRVVSIIPKSSVVGLLLEHEKDYVVVDSSQQGLFQHDGFSWQVLGPGFVRLEGVTRRGRLNDLVMKEWIANMSLVQRERFVNGLFDVLEASGARTLTDLKEERFKAAEAMVDAMKDMDKDTRAALVHAVKLLFRSGVKIWLEELQQEGRKKDRQKSK